MHSAPSVSYPVGRSRIWAALLAGLALLGMAAVGAWTLQVDAAAPRRALAWGAWLVATAAALHQWHRRPRGTLAWDGQGWSWHATGDQAQAGQPVLALDLQSGLLLRWHGHQPLAAWLWLERGAAADRWHDLRRAVYSRASPDEPQQPGPAAKP